MLKPFHLTTLAPLAILAICVAQTYGAGLIITKEGGLLEIDEHRVNVTINESIAITQVTQVFHNMEDRVVDGVFTFPVPARASIAGFSMWINGREMIGEVIEKQAAREIYTIEKSRGHDPGVLEQADYRTFNFRMAAIPPKALQKVQVTYYQELNCDGQSTTYAYPLANYSQPIVNSRVSKFFSMTFDVKSADGVVDLASPSHAKAMDVKRYAQTYARGTITALGASLDRDVVLAWHGTDKGTIARLTAFRENDSDGYFRLSVRAGEETASDIAGADYVFLLDVSGSMRDDDKLGQSCGTLSALLELLRPEDEFEVVSFNAAPQAALGRLVPANDINRREAGAFLASRRARGGTDFNRALSTAYHYARAGRVLNIVLISDGLSEQSQIPSLTTLVAQRPAGSRILCVGVGNDVDRALLTRMADSTGGLAAFISAGDNFHRQALGLQRKLHTPAITNASVEIQGGSVREVIPLRTTNLFAGVPVNIYGRYSTPGPATITLKGIRSGKDFVQSFNIDFPREADADPQIQRMWAWSRVDQLLNSRHLTSRDIDKIVWLGQQYSIASEYTSFIVLENDAAYSRWKIAQRNARQLTQDRDAQSQLSAQLEELRRKAPAGLNEPVAAASKSGSGIAIAAPASLVNNPSAQVSTAAPAPTGRPYGGAMDWLTGLLAVVLGVWAIGHKGVGSQQVEPSCASSR